MLDGEGCLVGRPIWLQEWAGGRVEQAAISRRRAPWWLRDEGLDGDHDAHHNADAGYKRAGEASPEQASERADQSGAPTTDVTHQRPAARDPVRPQRHDKHRDAGQCDQRGGQATDDQPLLSHLPAELSHRRSNAILVGIRADAWWTRLAWLLSTVLGRALPQSPGTPLGVGQGSS